MVRRRKRTYEELRIAILSALDDDKTYSFWELERTVNTDWESIRKHARDLAAFRAVELVHGRLRITSQGKDALRRLQRLQK